MTDDLRRRAARHAALADVARLRIVDTLLLGDASPGALRQSLGMSSNLMAHHLRVLEEAGIVRRSRSQADRRRSYVHLVADSLPTAPGSDDAAAGRARALREAPRLAFVCTANSARSQLAAALWNAAAELPAVSAGMRPADRVSPGAIAAARRRGLALSQRPASVSEVLRPDDFVITVCDHAYEELEDARALEISLHWSVPDPVPAGTAAAFDAAASELEHRIRLVTHLGGVA